MLSGEGEHLAHSYWGVKSNITCKRQNKLWNDPNIIMIVLDIHDYQGSIHGRDRLCSLFITEMTESILIIINIYINAESLQLYMYNNIIMANSKPDLLRYKTIPFCDTSLSPDAYNTEEQEYHDK